MKLYIFKIWLRGQMFWCHAPTASAAVADFTKQTGEPIEDYGLEWSGKNLDGSELGDDERVNVFYS